MQVPRGEGAVLLPEGQPARRRAAEYRANRYPAARWRPCSPCCTHHATGSSAQLQCAATRTRRRGSRRRAVPWLECAWAGAMAVLEPAAPLQCAVRSAQWCAVRRGAHRAVRVTALLPAVTDESVLCRAQAEAHSGVWPSRV